MEEERWKKVKGEKTTKRAGIAVAVVEVASNRGMPWEQAWTLTSEVHLQWRLTPPIDH